MPDIFNVAERYRRELLAREREAAGEMVRAYGLAWQRIKGQLDNLCQQIAEAKERGENVTPSWLVQHDRLEALQRQVEQEIARFVQFVEGRIIDEQAEAVRAAQAHSESLLAAGLGEPPPGVMVTFNRLHTEAVTDLVGFLQDGSPLRTLLDELGPEASQQVRRALIAGLATGQNPRVIARRVRQALGGNLARALRIARTEVLRAYREAAWRTYEANADVVKGWVWHASLSHRTCPACIALHGSFHTLDERLSGHPNCRCAMIPVTKTWEELGFKGVPESQIEVESGEDWLAKQPDDTQRQILGPKFPAYKAGKITLKDVVGYREDPRWGPMFFERSSRDIALGRAALPSRSPLEWRLAALDRRFGEWSPERALELGDKLEDQLALFRQQLERHVSHGGVKRQPLSLASMVKEGEVIFIQYQEAQQILAEARALTRWHLYHKYRRESLYLIRGVTDKWTLEKIKSLFNPVGFPCSTTDAAMIAIKKFGGAYGTTIIMEVPVEDILYCYEVSRYMQNRFPDEHEFILSPHASPKILDAAIADKLKLWYNGVNVPPRRKP